MKKVYSAANITDSHIICGLLEAEGISAHIDGEFLQGAIGELPAVGLISVNVEDVCLVEAENVIEKYDQGDYELQEE